jgi:hypothetical protein
MRDGLCLLASRLLSAGRVDVLVRLVAIVAVLLMAGCSGTSSGPFEDHAILGSFPDAKHRFTNSTIGQEHELTYSFVVAQGQSQIRLKGIYRADGDGSFVLRMPDGNGARFDTFPAAKQSEDETWFERNSPPGGRWSFNAHLTDGGAYAFGVYLR